jgi:uncharacterized protein involved in tolerance to divalent cations
VAPGNTLNTIDLSGDWWTAWQTFRDGRELIAVQPAHITQDDELLQIVAKERGLSDEDGGYLWRGELRLWDNELLMGWYAAADGAVRSKGTIYFALHPHGERSWGRWVGMSYDGRVITGWRRWPAPRTGLARSRTSSARPKELPRVEPIVSVAVTAPDADWLTDFTRAVVTDHLAASGNILPAIRSIYRWKGAVEDHSEAMVILHTRQALVHELVERLNDEHPYDTPQVLALPVTDANPLYHRWVIDETREPNKPGG